MQGVSLFRTGRSFGGVWLAVLVLVTAGGAAAGSVTTAGSVAAAAAAVAVVAPVPELPELPVLEAPVADAAQRGDVDAVRALLREGADVNAAQGDGMTALHWAAHSGDVELAAVLARCALCALAYSRGEP